MERTDRLATGRHGLTAEMVGDDASRLHTVDARRWVHLTPPRREPASLMIANVHPFWIRWLYAFAPTCFSSDVAQLYSMADQLSGPFKASHPLHRETSRPQSLQEIYSQPRPARTALSIARAQAPRVCVPCRINRLNSQHVPKADRNYATWTPMFGSVGVCWGHVESWCHYCLRDDQLIALDDYGRKSRMMRPPGVKDLNIYPSKRGDTDDEGRGRRTESDICVGCRLDAIQYQLEKVVEQCAAGGPIRAKEMVYELPQTTTPGRSYVDWGRGTARLAAVRAVEEKWLTHQARWAEMCEMAVDVQKTEQSMRELLRNHGELGRDGSKFTTKRAALLAEMHGDEDGLEGNWWMGYQWELAESMARWKLDWQQGAVDEEYDVDDEDFEAHELSERVSRDLRGVAEASGGSARGRRRCSTGSATGSSTDSGYRQRTRFCS